MGSRGPKECGGPSVLTPEATTVDHQNENYIHSYK